MLPVTMTKKDDDWLSSLAAGRWSLNDELFNWLLAPISAKDERIDLALGLRSKGEVSVLTAPFLEDIFYG